MKARHSKDGDHAAVRGTSALKGALASKKGKGMSFAQIRATAARAAIRCRGE